MKKLLFSLTIAMLAGQALADIQDPPMNAYTPNRKLGRGLANMFFAPTELGVMVNVNQADGNAAAFSTGIVKAINRMVMRIGVGFYEVVTYPFPTHRRSYAPVLKSNIPWVNNGYEEYPPELGFQSRKNYCAFTDGY